MPSSRVRPLATYAVAFLRVARSLASHLMMFIVGPFMGCSVSSIYPSCSWYSSSSLPTHAPKHHIIIHSVFLSLLPQGILDMSCPKYLKAACATPDSTVHFGLMFSSTQTLVFLSVQHNRAVSNTTSQMHQLSCAFYKKYINQKESVSTQKCD